MNDESNLETEKRPEQRESQAVESRPELTEAGQIQGAEMLETPADGSFLHGLQTFIAWVKSITGLADDK
jgi:hypothetical protein